MSELENNRIVAAFDQARQEGRKQLLPFLTAGYPSLEITEALLHDIERRGARICELGVPFSDPVADGPTIQASYVDALAAGVTVDGIFEMVRRYRSAGGAMGLISMVSYSIVYRRGVEAYVRAAADAGLDGLIIPDLSLEEAATVEQIATSAGLCNIMLISPNTPPSRRRQIASHCRGFIYFMSVVGITGERDRLPEPTIVAVGELRHHTDTPICVGFGISRPEMVATVCEVAEGAIVGSAIVKRITAAKDKPADQLVPEVGDFVGELLEPIKAG
ncbi:MAG: tryptophan synthase subunit alpha [Phycisphaerae bacterium]